MIEPKGALPGDGGKARQEGRQYMAIDIGYASAIAAGALSFLSPCVLPLVPP